ncbi:MAG: glycoside hydrolase family 19 protein [Bacteroidota bacterium]
MIAELCPKMNAERATALQAIFDAVCLKYAITDKNDKAAFVAQMCHESGEFTIKTESMNYTTPQRIVDIWPSRFNLDGSGGKHNANEYIKNSQKLANEVYAGRMGNGDAASGDGFRFRGAGFLQMTGREDFGRYAQYIGKDIAETSDLVRNDDHYAMDSAAWEYVIKSKLLGQKDFVHITKVINGGKIGLEERTRYYKKALEIAA